VNLITHSLGANFYLVLPPQDPALVRQWAERTDEAFSEARLELLLRNLSLEIGAKTMSFSAVTYQPHGASANLLIAQHISALAHLDASHISTHTYFDLGDLRRWSSFRLELEISTCGDIHPVVCLENLFKGLNPHFVTLDTRSRGISTDKNGELKLVGQSAPPAELTMSGSELSGYEKVVLGNENVAFIARGLSTGIAETVRGLFG